MLKYLKNKKNFWGIFLDMGMEIFGYLGMVLGMGMGILGGLGLFFGKY
jgi:hypothetical protein